jgi:hypothetical protein
MPLVLTRIGGGAFAVIPLTERGKLPDLIPLFKGHSAPVLDTDFNPFNDSVIASGSDDGNVPLLGGLPLIARYVFGPCPPISLF